MNDQACPQCGYSAEPAGICPVHGTYATSSNVGESRPTVDERLYNIVERYAGALETLGAESYIRESRTREDDSATRGRHYRALSKLRELAHPDQERKRLVLMLLDEGWTLERIASKTGVTRQAVWKWRHHR